MCQPGFSPNGGGRVSRRNLPAPPLVNGPLEAYMTQEAHVATGAKAQAASGTDLRRIEHLASLSIARGCSFAALGIFALMVGLADLTRSLQAGGYLTFLVCLTLLLKARDARSEPYRETELWLLLADDERPDAAAAQRIIGDVLRDAYLRYAQEGAFIAACLLAAAIATAIAFGGLAR
jgi:hypothetical protein